MQKCNKKKFDEIMAQWAIAHAKHSTDKQRKELRYYWCAKCKAYHLTSQPKKEGGNDR